MYPHSPQWFPEHGFGAQPNKLIQSRTPVQGGFATVDKSDKKYKYPQVDLARPS
jgi:hypothetical protein